MNRFTNYAKKLYDFFRLNYLGTIFGLIGFLLALTPSLMPRPAELLGVVGGIGFAMGYGVGLLASTTLRHSKFFTELHTATKQRAWRCLAVAAPLYIIAVTALSGYWQNDLLLLLDQDPIEEIGIFIIISLAAVTFAIVLLVSRGFMYLYRRVRLLIGKIPVPLPYIGGILAAILILVLVLELSTGLLQRTAAVAIRASYSARNNSMDSAHSQPTSPLRSGSVASESKWEGLGLQGRRFISAGPTAVEIEKFTGETAKEPIRVYVGIENAKSRDERIAMTVRELERTGAFDRKLLMIATPTGTGWIEGETAASFEFMHGGDTAIATAQYSYLPSGLSFIMDRDEATAMGKGLFKAIELKVNQLPESSRPKLITYGLSLGSFGGQSSFANEQDLAERVDGALFVGTPGFSEPWRTFTRERDAKSLQIKPVYNSERVLKFANDTRDIPYDADAAYKAIYFQYATDPFVWWDASLAYRKPDWISEELGRGVSERLRWTPVLTFIQISVDQAFSLTIPGDNGHDYSHDTAAATAAASKPANWSTLKSQLLQNYIELHYSD